MQAYCFLVLSPVSSFDGFACSRWPWLASRDRRRLFTTSAAHRNHYDILGISQDATSADIKRAYRLLALKYHPDVNKETGASENFKSIRVAYDILIDETSRTDYDKALCCQKSSTPFKNEPSIDPEYNNNRLRFYQWAYQRRRSTQADHHTEFSSFDDDDDESANGERGSTFIEVVRSTFISVFLMHTVGIQLSLAFSSLMAFVDGKLDAGYKLGYLCAWILGGRAGIMLTVLLSFASWACGKRSSSVVALVVVAVWIGSNLARYAPLPQGALLTLLYMSIRLQLDLT
ncbi:uncharacterized protein LOC127263754 [Andrographis paniculata]|uniref:uncharacterized protein LOC127263754 n=1 Tax=Andrographis paniculata TaxID=175694 RepID=UPI0021E84958|nr:uncharacterized protein LOC127263754 [Andrographis paniculata]